MYFMLNPLKSIYEVNVKSLKSIYELIRLLSGDRSKQILFDASVIQKLSRLIE